MFFHTSEPGCLSDVQCVLFLFFYRLQVGGSWLKKKQQLSPLLVRLLSNEKGPLSSPCTALQLSVRIVSGQTALSRAFLNAKTLHLFHALLPFACC